MYACRYGTVDVVESFLNHSESARIDYNCKASNGQTAFMMAEKLLKLEMRNNHRKEIVKLLKTYPHIIDLNLPNQN